MSGNTVETCDHPPTSQRIDVFRTAVPRDHPGYSESRRVTCEVCGFCRCYG